MKTKRTYQPMLDYRELGLFCEYEYCIEDLPLDHGDLSCPVWGHDCPGGISKINSCKKRITDIPEKRIYRGKIKIIEGVIYKDES